ncbi:MAG: PspA/IM30 family protein [Chloroflexi bacterium]|nr:PspA/IM30 family protein [Chloroflexota bacterium]
MGVLSRMSTILKSKMSRLLDKAEDPRETLDYSYEKQLELLRNVKRGIVEVVTSKRRLELQASKVQESIAKLDKQARQALGAGREDLARLALQRKQAALQELQGLDEQVSGLELEQEKLTQAEARLQSKVEAFRTKKEIIKAQYTAAEAQVRIGSALSGVSEEMADVGMAIDRAQNKTEQMRAKAAAIDELASAGVLEDFTGREDEIGRELAKLSASRSVETELAALKEQSSERKELPGGRP